MKKIIAVLFLGFFLVATFAPTSLNFRAHAQSIDCNNDNIKIAFNDTTPIAGQNLIVTFGAHNAGDYLLWVHSADNENDVVIFDATSAELQNVSAHTSVTVLVPLGSKIVAGKSYTLKVRQAGFGSDCGRGGFIVEDSSTPFDPQIEVGPLSSDKKTLTSIAASGLQANKNYMFELNGNWEWDWLEDSNKKGKERFSFKSDDKGSIVVRNICENGAANRTNCEEIFKPGTYQIDLFDAESITWLATETFTLGEIISPTEVPGLVASGSADVNVVASGFARTFLSFGIGIAGGIAFLLMVFGAYRLIFAGGNPESIQQGREIITAAIAGLLVIVFAMFILRFLGYTILGLGGL